MVSRSCFDGEVLEAGGGSQTYAVVTDQLLAASQAVLDITASAQAATIETLPQSVGQVGHDRLDQVFRDFCARWDNGLSHLVGDSEAVAQRLDSCASAYLENEDVAADGYRQMPSCAPPDLRAVLTPPPVWPSSAWGR